MYTILDIYSRYVVGYLIAQRELASLAKQLVADSCAKQEIEPDQLILHADRGSSMTSKTLALLLADLGVGKSHSRPYVSDDNPFSEAQFKTMKYRPDYPDHFGGLHLARIWARSFFHWYHHEHRHTSLGLMTPANCGPAYPTVCIPPPPPDLDCGEIPFRNFTVLPPGPHRFDGDNDGVGCAT